MLVTMIYTNTEIYGENKTEHGKRDEVPAFRQRNHQSIIIGITAVAAVLISVFALALLSDTGNFRILVFNHFADAGSADEENQELTSGQDNAAAGFGQLADFTWATIVYSIK